eukprot:10488454-Karenia_brevis.AAC.1
MLRQPYMDPVLARSKLKYCEFLWRLKNRGIINWTLAGERKASAGAFFVEKSDGSLRLIFDTRIANTRFIDPPKTSLPTTGAFSKIETSDSKCFLASGDIK